MQDEEQSGELVQCLVDNLDNIEDERCYSHAFEQAELQATDVNAAASELRLCKLDARRHCPEFVQRHRRSGSGSGKSGSGNGNGSGGGDDGGDGDDQSSGRSRQSTVVTVFKDGIRQCLAEHRSELSKVCAAAEYVR